MNCPWTEEQKNAVVDQAMDLAVNADRFRAVIVLTITEDGTLNVTQKWRDTTTRMEILGVYRLLAVNTEHQLMMAWHDNDRPMSEDNDA